MDRNGLIDTRSIEARMGAVRNILRFSVDLVSLYLIAIICVPWLASTVYNRVMPALGTSQSGSSLQFLCSHLFVLSFIPTFAVTSFVNNRYNHTLAQLLWIVPVTILAYKFVTFPASVFESRFTAAINYYFCGDLLIPEFHNFRELFRIVVSNPDARRGMDQLWLVAPVYAGMGYSIGAFVSRKRLLRLPNS